MSILKIPKINFFVLVIILNLFLAAAQLYLTTLRATIGHQLSDLQNQLLQTQTENQSISTRVYSLSSLSYIQSQADGLRLARLKPQFISPLPIAAAVNQP